MAPFARECPLKYSEYLLRQRPVFHAMSAEKKAHTHDFKRAGRLYYISVRIPDRNMYSSSFCIQWPKELIFIALNQHFFYIKNPTASKFSKPLQPDRSRQTNSRNVSALSHGTGKIPSF
jgi:hypothetical protein